MRNFKYLILAIFGILLYAISPTSLKKWVLLENGELNHLKLYSYDDHTEGGSSNIIDLIENDNGISWSYFLGSKLDSPYCGFGLTLDQDHPNESDMLDLSYYDSLTIEIKSKIPQNLNLNIYTADPKFTDFNNKKSFKLNTKEFSIDEKWQRISIPLDQLYTPDWWFQQNNVQPDWNQKHLHRVWKIEFTPDYKFPVDSKDLVEIRYMKLAGYSNTGFGVLMIYLLLILILSIGLKSGVSKKIKNTKENLK